MFCKISLFGSGLVSVYLSHISGDEAAHFDSVQSDHTPPFLLSHYNTETPTTTPLNHPICAPRRATAPQHHTTNAYYTVSCSLGFHTVPLRIEM